MGQSQRVEFQVRQSFMSAELTALEEVLLNTSGKVPLHRRFRALFALKSLKNDDAVAIISKGVVHSLRYTLS